MMTGPRHYQESGFTLIELLVVLAISGIILGAVMQIFINSQVIYSVQEEVAAMQQNVRTAKMFLERDVRMAGSGVMNFDGPNQSQILPIQFINNTIPNTPDILTVIYEMPNNNPCGNTAIGAPVLCNELPPLTLVGTLDNSSVNASILDELTGSTWLNTCYCNGTVYDLSSGNFPVVARKEDRSRLSILIATDLDNNPTIEDSFKFQNTSLDQLPVPNTEGFPKPSEVLAEIFGVSINDTLPNKQASNQFPAGSVINFLAPTSIYNATYSIATVDGIDCLVRDLNDGNGPEVIAEHIEDFQCSFELADGTIVDNSDLTTTQVPEVRLVTINVFGRTAHEHKQGIGKYDGQRTDVAGNPIGDPDNFRRRRLTVTVKVRNFGLN